MDIGKKYIIQQDGDLWFCAQGDFINLAESDAEFGGTPSDALRCFLEKESGTAPSASEQDALSTALEEMGKSIERALEECDLNDVMAVLASALVGITVELARRKGADTTKQITIQGGYQRDITIHPLKSAQQTQGGA